MVEPMVVQAIGQIHANLPNAIPKNVVTTNIAMNVCENANCKNRWI